MRAIPRELAREERAAIHKLVTKLCANYSREYSCLPLETDCYMLGLWWTGAYCRYFESAVLPLDPSLEAALTGGAVDMRSCAVCGAAFVPKGIQRYCSAICAKKAQRRQQREFMRKKRGGC